MKTLKQFKIPFKGLSLGAHDYDWEVDNRFFEAIENPDVLDCKVWVNLRLEKQERMMVLEFDISGHLYVCCDRCLEKFNLPLNISENYFIKFGEEYKEESESILVIPETEYQIDISELIFDFISLAIPIKKVHLEDKEGNSTCSETALSRLAELSEQKRSDPRWDALKNIKLDNNK